MIRKLVWKLVWLAFWGWALGYLTFYALASLMSERPLTLGLAILVGLSSLGVGAWAVFSEDEPAALAAAAAAERRAHADLEAGAVSDAIAAFQQALSLRRKHLPGSLDVTKTLIRLSRAHLRSRQYREAIKAGEEGHALIHALLLKPPAESKSGLVPLLVVLNAQNQRLLGEARTALKEHAAAAQNFLNAAELWDRARELPSDKLKNFVAGDGDPCAENLLRAAQAAALVGDTTQAIELNERTLANLEKSFAPLDRPRDELLEWCRAALNRDNRSKP